ncbi:hypothetical protein AgCh_005643 [Apium graveolens]
MVSKIEEVEVNKLENQVENGGGGAWEYLSLVRKLKLRRHNQVLKHGLSLLNNSNLRSSLGPDGLHKGFAEEVSEQQESWLEAMLLEAKGSWQHAEKAYSSLLEGNPSDQVLYTLGGLEKLHTTKKYYAYTIDLTGGKNTRALMGICLCTSTITQLTKGRNKEEKESFELQSLVVTALEKDYKDRSPNSLLLLTSTLRCLQINT